MKNIALLILVSLLSACGKPPAAPASASAQNTVTASPAKTGADRDPHGCIGSAGYVWSALKQRCLRLFEDGIRLTAINTGPESTQAAYLLFDETQTRAEIFLPEEKEPIRLQRQGEEGAHFWAAGKLKLIPWKGYVLQEDGKAIYGGQ